MALLRLLIGLVLVAVVALSVACGGNKPPQPNKETNQAAPKRPTEPAQTPPDTGPDPGPLGPNGKPMK